MNSASRPSLRALTALLALTVALTAYAQGSDQNKSVDPKAYLIQPEVEASVTREANNILAIRWTIDADKVEVFAGSRPDAIYHAKPLARVKGKKEVKISGLSPTTRYYFDLKFSGGPEDGKTLTVAERFLPLKGAVNFRDVGGYRTADGSHVRWGAVYRSEGLSKLTESDLDYLSHNLHLSLVCDLRGPTEVKTAPDRLPERNQPEVLHLPIDSSSKTMGQMIRTVLKGDPKQIDDAMAEGYINMVDTKGAEVFGPFLAHLADPKALPIVTHCTAGKDRTGIATALLLTVLGVPRQTVIADYSLTNAIYDTLAAELKNNKAMAAMGLNSQKLAPLMLAKPVWMERTLDHIQQKYGSVEEYLKTVAHLDDDALAKIRANLLQ